MAKGPASGRGKTSLKKKKKGEEKPKIPLTKEEKEAKKWKYTKNRMYDDSGKLIKLDKKERKRLSAERKAKKNPHYTTIQECVTLWEQLRRHETPPEKRAELVSQILSNFRGKLADISMSPAASRVVQACVAHGNPKQRADMLAEIASEDKCIFRLSKNPYGKFLVQKLIANATKDQIPVFMKALKGHFIELLRHPAGTHVVDELYTVANASQRNAMAAEFYAREYSLFSDGTLNNMEGPPTSLNNLLSRVAQVEPKKQKNILKHLTSALNPIIEKGLVDCQLAHRLIAEYLHAAPGSLVADAVGTLSGNPLLHMMHTRQGAIVGSMIFAYGTVKSRKKAARALKGHVGAAAKDEWGSLVLMTALSVIDDTALLKKNIINDIARELPDIIQSKSAHRILIQLLNPSSPRLLPPELALIVSPPPKIVQNNGVNLNGNPVEILEAQPPSEVDPTESRKSDSDSDDEGGEGGRMVPTPGPLGKSKKDPVIRRQELLEGFLAQEISKLAKEKGSELVKTQYAADVMVEVLRGGQDGVLETVLGKEKFDEILDSVTAALQGEAGKEIMDDYIGSRVLKRVIVASKEDGAESAATRFAEKMYENALKGRVKELKDGHAAKVIAALVQGGNEKVKKEVGKELKAAGIKDAEAWAGEFVGKKKKGLADEGKEKKRKENHDKEDSEKTKKKKSKKGKKE